MALTKQQKTALITGAFILAIVISVALFMPPADENNQEEFYSNLSSSDQVALVMDIRDADPVSKQNILQCGVNMIAGGFFAVTEKDLTIYACDESGCLKTNAMTDSDITEEELAESSIASELKEGSAVPGFETIYGESTEGIAALNQTLKNEILGNQSNNSINQTDIDKNEDDTVEAESNKSESEPGEDETIDERLDVYSEKESGQETDAIVDDDPAADATLVSYEDMLLELKEKPYFHLRAGDEQKTVYHKLYMEQYLNASTDASQCRLSIRVGE